MYRFLSSDTGASCLAWGLLVIAAAVLWCVSVDAIAAMFRAWLDGRRVGQALRRWSRGGVL